MATAMDQGLPGVGSPLRVFPTTNAERMYALDEAWNARDWDTFGAYHDPDHVIVYWPERQFTGTFTGPLELPDGTVIQPTGKSFDVFFSTTARWRNGKIVEEYLFYDSATLMQQIGLG
jgi:SnoaL-like polyketide cyclase